MATPIPDNEASFTVWELCAATGGRLVHVPDEHARVSGLSTDSRAVVPGRAFIALRGESFDGHAFVQQAAQRGATVVVVARGAAVPGSTGERAAVIEVDDTLTALGLLARAHLRRWRRSVHAGARVAAITGSAGKTSTKDLTAAIVSAVGPCHATTGNLNNLIGVPAVALGVGSQPFAVFELGMSVPGEIAALTRIVEPDVGAVLNVGVAHASSFGGSRGEVAREKGALLELLGPDAVAVVNVDDGAACAQLLRTSARTHVGFGAAPHADVRLVRREPRGLHGSRVTVGRGAEAFDVVLGASGEAAALNLVAAVAIADATVGRPVPAEVIAKAVASWTPTAGRCSVRELGGGVVVIDDTYNANPSSMRAAFATLGEFRQLGRQRHPSPRAIAVLGEMRELGPIAEHEHGELGKELGRLGVDIVIGYGALIEATLRNAEALGVSVRRAGSAVEAGSIIAREARSGDVILFKGSRGAEVERALSALLARLDGLPHTPSPGVAT